jgi:hypothetical protein
MTSVCPILTGRISVRQAKTFFVVDDLVVNDPTEFEVTSNSRTLELGDLVLCCVRPLKSILTLNSRIVLCLISSVIYGTRTSS